MDLYLYSFSLHATFTPFTHTHTARLKSIHNYMLSNHSYTHSYNDGYIGRQRGVQCLAQGLFDMFRLMGNCSSSWATALCWPHLDLQPYFGSGDRPAGGEGRGGLIVSWCWGWCWWGCVRIHDWSGGWHYGGVTGRMWVKVGCEVCVDGGRWGAC